MKLNPEELLAWYRSHARDLPWRGTDNPYAVWVSEVMLQQTQVSTVIPYFARWMERFPTVRDLANATEEEALSIWQGLGYYRRCKNLMETARIVSSYGWPRSAQEWRRLPGVGAYTANAIASFALGERVPVVDGNVERVFARLTGCAASGSELHRRAWAWAESQLPLPWTSDWNQALMELGAVVCIPRDPACAECPVSSVCEAHRRGLQDRLPTPRPRPEVRELAFRVEVPWATGRFGVHQPEEQRWWKGMWVFPTQPVAQDCKDAAWSGSVWASGCDLVDLGTFRHTVTRHRLTFAASLVGLDGLPPELRWLTPHEMATLPMPAVYRRILERATKETTGYQ